MAQYSSRRSHSHSHSTQCAAAMKRAVTAQLISRPSCSAAVVDHINTSEMNQMKQHPRDLVDVIAFDKPILSGTFRTLQNALSFNNFSWT